jgi:uncharacterized membrane protein YbhN (UPF0104 family)
MLAHIGVLALVALDVVMRALRIRVLLPVPMPQALAITTSSDALAAFTPGRLGGEPLRFMAFRRRGVASRRILAAFGTELVVDAVVLVALAGVFLLGAPRSSRGRLEAVTQAAASGGVSWVVLAALALLVAALALAGRRGWIPWRRSRRSLAQAWRLMRVQPALIVAVTATLTLASVASRIAILPVLVADWHLPVGAVLRTSFAMVCGLLAVPTPGGVGAVELGLATGFAGRLGLADLGRLILVWRFYTLALGTAAGGLLLVFRRSWHKTRS